MKTKAKIYQMPENYIRRQQWTSFLNENRYPGTRLLCWFISPETGRLIGVYCPEETSIAWIKAWHIHDDGFQYDDDGKIKVSSSRLYGLLRESKETYCTDYMPFFSGISSKYPAKPEGKICPFKINEIAPKNTESEAPNCNSLHIFEIDAAGKHNVFKDLDEAIE